VEPLTVNELLHALATEVGQSEMNIDNLPSRSTFLDCCLGLVIVDDETSSVRFVHYSFQEYMNSQDRFPQLGDERAHEIITRICLIYLCFEATKEVLWPS
jgi:hypothetical protein